MAKIFILPEGVGPEKGQYVINDRYVFENGEMLVADDDTASKLEPILCRYYGCEVEDVPEVKGDEAKSGEPSLSAAQTKK